MIHVDLDHPRVSHTEGEPVFLPQGGNSPYLDHIARCCAASMRDWRSSKAMFAAFAALDLIEPVTLDVKLSAEEEYSVRRPAHDQQEKLRGARREALLERLNRAGFLQGAFLVIASMGNVKKLMAMKQRKRRQRTAAATGSLSHGSRSPERFAYWKAVGRTTCRCRICWPAASRLVLKGLVDDWALVRAGLRLRPARAMDYLRSLLQRQDRSVLSFGEPQIAGRPSTTTTSRS